MQQLNDMIYCEAIIMSHFHAHRCVTHEIRERLNGKELAGIGKKEDPFRSIRKIRKLQDGGHKEDC